MQKKPKPIIYSSITKQLQDLIDKAWKVHPRIRWRHYENGIKKILQKNEKIKPPFNKIKFYME